MFEKRVQIRTAVVRRIALAAALGGVLSIPAGALAVGLYIIFGLHDRIGAMTLLALTPGFLIREVPLGAVAGLCLAAAATAQSKLAIALAVFAACIAGAAFGLLAAGNSPHISATFAAGCGIVSFGSLALLAAVWLLVNQSAA